jgi:anti-sigma B factor antagonist
MDISVKHEKENVILRVSGSILGDDRLQLSDKIEELVESGGKNVVLNLQDVDLMDSVGLGMMVALRASLMRREVRLLLSNVDRSVKSLLLITKLNNVFDLYDTEAEALADLDSVDRDRFMV